LAPGPGACLELVVGGQVAVGGGGVAAAADASLANLVHVAPVVGVSAGGVVRDVHPGMRVGGDCARDRACGDNCGDGGRIDGEGRSDTFGRQRGGSGTAERGRNDGGFDHGGRASADGYHKSRTGGKIVHVPARGRCGCPILRAAHAFLIRSLVRVCYTVSSILALGLAGVEGHVTTLIVEEPISTRALGVRCGLNQTAAGGYGNSDA